MGKKESAHYRSFPIWQVILQISRIAGPILIE